MHIHPGPQRRRLYRMDCHGAACELSALAQVAIDCRHGWPPRQLQTAPHTQVSKVLRKWFLTTCSVVPMIFPISRLVRPCHTRVANLNLLGGEALTWRHDACSSLAKDGDSQLYALAAIANSGTQEKRALVLFYGARANV